MSPVVMGTTKGLTTLKRKTINEEKKRQIGRREGETMTAAIRCFATRDYSCAKKKALVSSAVEAMHGGPRTRNWMRSDTHELRCQYLHSLAITRSCIHCSLS